MHNKKKKKSFFLEAWLKSDHEVVARGQVHLKPVAFARENEIEKFRAARDAHVGQDVHFAGHDNEWARKLVQRHGVLPPQPGLVDRVNGVRLVFVGEGGGRHRGESLLILFRRSAPLGQFETCFLGARVF